VIKEKKGIAHQFRIFFNPSGGNAAYIKGLVQYKRLGSTLIP
jgi:hypothetical protein